MHARPFLRALQVSSGRALIHSYLTFPLIPVFEDSNIQPLLGPGNLTFPLIPVSEDSDIQPLLGPGKDVSKRPSEGVQCFLPGAETHDYHVAVFAGVLDDLAVLDFLPMPWLRGGKDSACQRDGILTAENERQREREKTTREKTHKLWQWRAGQP